MKTSEMKTYSKMVNGLHIHISMQRNYLNTSRITNALHKLMNEWIANAKNSPNFVCKIKSKPVYIMIYSKISNSYQTNKQTNNHPANRWLSLAARNAAKYEKCLVRNINQNALTEWIDKHPYVHSLPLSKRTNYVRMNNNNQCPLSTLSMMSDQRLIP